MDLQQVKQIAESHYILNDNPLLVIDLRSIRNNYQEFKANFPNVEVHFALKSLTDKEVVKVLSREGCNFEVASLNELQLLGKLLSEKQLQKVFYSNPAKTRRSIMIALIAGIRWFSVDSIEEIRKIGNVARSLQIPLENIRLYLRIQATSKNSVWPLSAKFGAPQEKAVEIISDLVNDGMKLSGFTFHVGSQCLDHEAWGNAILSIDYLIEQATILDVITEKVMINLGGGFPCDIMHHNITLEKISDYIIICLDKCVNAERIHLAAEPGRFISSNSGVLASRIILRTSKAGDNWLYLDTGVYHGMIEPSQGMMGNVTTTFNSIDKSRFILAGPTCDSADVIPMQVNLPSNIREDDLIFIEHSGAYSMAYATGHAETLQPGFNGFLPPSVYYLHK